MINNMTFEEQARHGVAVSQQFISLLGTGQIFIHNFFVTSASSILFHLAPCRFFHVLSPSHPIKFVGDQRKYTVALKISVTVVAFIIFKGLI